MVKLTFIAYHAQGRSEFHQWSLADIAGSAAYGQLGVCQLRRLFLSLQ